jgi:hypothetical protein
VKLARPSGHFIVLVQAAAPTTESCACGRAPRRLCDVCYSTQRVFMACSAGCLAEHQRARHPEQAGVDAPTRARAFAASVNARFPENWERYAPHRHQLMQLVEGVGTGGRLAVLGAGNASDLELSWLVERFEEVHLVDLDAHALERARARHSLQHPERLVLRGGVDLSGLLGRLDTWGDDFPEPATLGAAAVEAASALVHELGSFDVTLSTCVLSQLALPFRRAWVASRTSWGHLTSAITSVHLATLAGMSARASVLTCDVQTTERVPELDQFRGASHAELGRFVLAAVDEGRLALHPDPRQLVGWLRAPGLSRLVSSPRLTEPWLWDLGEVRQLVYGLVFQRANA